MADDVFKSIATNELVTGVTTLDCNRDAIALNLTTTASTSTNYALKVVTGAGAFPAKIGYDLSTCYVEISNQAGNTGSTLFFRNITAAATSVPVVAIEQEHAADDQSSLLVIDDGLSDGSITVDKNNTGAALVIDKDVASTAGTEYGIKIMCDVAAGGGAGAGIDLSSFSAGEITINFPAGDASAVDPGSANWEDGWINIGVGGTLYYIPYCAVS